MWNETKPLGFNEVEPPEEESFDDLEQWNDGYLDEDDAHLMRQYRELAIGYE